MAFHATLKPAGFSLTMRQVNSLLRTEPVLSATYGGKTRDWQAFIVLADDVALSLRGMSMTRRRIVKAVVDHKTKTPTPPRQDEPFLSWPELGRKTP